MPFVIVESLEVGPIVEDAERYDGESEDVSIGFEMAADGLLVGGDGDVGVHSAINDIAGDVEQVGWGIFFNEGVAWRKAGIIDDMDVVTCERADAGKDDCVFDFFFSDGFFKSFKQVCVVFEANNNDSCEVTCGGMHSRARRGWAVLNGFGRLRAPATSHQNCYDQDGGNLFHKQLLTLYYLASANTL